MKALLIDDHELVRTALRILIERGIPGAKIFEAGSAASALAAAAREPWDLIILDIDLPDRSGLDVIADILRQRKTQRILVLTGHGGAEFGARALRGGASGFVEKIAGNKQILEAVNRILAGQKYLSPDVAAAVLDEKLRGGAPAHEALSTREFEVLRLYGMGFTAAQIAGKLGVSIKTASTYRARIMIKLGLKTTGELVRYAVTHRLS